MLAGVRPRSSAICLKRDSVARATALAMTESTRLSTFFSSSFSPSAFLASAFFSSSFSFSPSAFLASAFFSSSFSPSAFLAAKLV
jgi:hypothetical protein